MSKLSLSLTWIMCLRLLQPAMAQVVPSDSLALVDLYNSTNGPQWQSSYNWLSENPVGTWYGVQVAEGRVTHIGFGLGNNLQGPLPPSLGNLTGLRSLGLPGNSITAIPAQIGNLGALQTLSLAYNQIALLPNSISGLANLSELDVSGNTLTAIPEEIGELTLLTTLYIEANQISALPSSIGNLTQLTTLNAMSNQIASLPPEIAGLRRMRHLYLGGNMLTELPLTVCTLDSLELLWLFGNQLSSLPPEIGNLTRLRDLHFQQNVLQSLPFTIGNLTLLQNIHLGENQLRTLPSEIGNLTALRSLRAFYNQLDSLPATIGNLTSLRDIWLQHNNLTSLPQSIGNLVNVTHLWLNDNNLSGPLPDTLSRLSNLVLLSLRNNSLTGAIPDRFGLLGGLGWLFLENNRLDDLPSFTGAPQLRVFTVFNNRLTFEDIEPSINLPFTLFAYAPQDSVGEERDTTLQAGSSLEIAVSVGGSANQYRWLKDGIEIVGSDSSILHLSMVDSTHSGAYTCRVSSNIVPFLEIHSRPMHVHVEGSVDVAEADDRVPGSFFLSQNYPNPFNPSTIFAFDIGNPSFVILKVYDILGREVATLVNERKEPGTHRVEFNAEGLPGGVYMYRMQAGAYSASKKMLLLR